MEIGMQVISFVAVKSMGKSTSLQVLAERLLSRGIDVHIVSLDPQGSQDGFAEEAKKYYPNLTHTPWSHFKDSDDQGGLLFDLIEEKREINGVILVDVQGTDNNLIEPAALYSNLTLVPMIDGPMERDQLKRTFRKLYQIDRMKKRYSGDNSKEVKLNVGVYYTKVTINLSHPARKVIDEAERIGFKFIGVNLMENSYFKHLCRTGSISHEDNLTPAKLKKRDNALSYADAWVEAIEGVL